MKINYTPNIDELQKMIYGFKKHLNSLMSPIYLSNNL